MGTWTAPVLVDASDSCTHVTATVDDNGHVYVADDCGATIHVTVGPTAGPWTTTAIDHPAGTLDSGPQLAIDGTTLYVAYTQASPEEGCGSNGLQPTAVMVRTQALPTGAWSDATRIGAAQDSLDSFRVNGGLIEATVEPGTGTDASLVFETVGSTTHRYSLPGLNSSLRIGSDGKARIAYETNGTGAGGAIAYAVFTGAGFSVAKIPGPSGAPNSTPLDPHLVLDAANHADVIWTVTQPPGGCVLPPGSSDDGTYFGTNRSGSWKVTRLTVSTGETSITLDPTTGQVHAVLADSALEYLTLPPGDAWQTDTVVPWFVASPVIREAEDGTLIAACIAQPDGQQDGVYVTTLPTDLQVP